MMLFFTWPSTFIDWFDFCLIVYIAVVVFTKAVMMTTNSRFFDRLGVSLIALNLAFVVAYAYRAALWVHPAWASVDVLKWMVRLVVAFAATWALFEMSRATRRAKRRRVRKAVA